MKSTFSTSTNELHKKISQTDMALSNLLDLLYNKQTLQSNEPHQATLVCKITFV